MAKRNRQTERAVAAGIRAVRSASRVNAGKLARSIIARGDAAKPIEPRFKQSIKRNVRELIASQFRGRDAPVKVAAAESILNAAGGNRTIARRQITERNEFGKTLAQELNGAKNKLLRRINRIIDDGVRRKRSRQEIADEVQDVAARNFAAQRVIAWHSARAANRAIIADLNSQGIVTIEILPSPSHPKRDICDPHFGIHRIGYRLPPYHPYCTCIVQKPAEARRAA